MTRQLYDQPAPVGRILEWHVTIARRQRLAIPGDSFLWTNFAVLQEARSEVTGGGCLTSLAIDRRFDRYRY